MATADHLFVQRFGFEHNGIDMGDGTVIEYGGKGTGHMSVRRVSWSEFARGGWILIRRYKRGVALPPAETIQLALKRLHEQDYDLFDNNCEHLAYRCKTGHHWSPQADRLKSMLNAGIAVAAVAVIAEAL